MTIEKIGIPAKDAFKLSNLSDADYEVRMKHC